MNGHQSESTGLITGIAHVNLTVPAGTLEQANAFYGETLGLKARPVPQLQKGTLAWYGLTSKCWRILTDKDRFDIADSGQQVHQSLL